MNYAGMKATELRALVAENPAAQDALGQAVSKANKAALVASLEAAEKPARKTRRSWTDEQAAEVARLRHEELMSWPQISAQLGFNTAGVARRAYRAATGCTGPLPRLAGKGGRPTAGMVAGTEAPEVLGTDEA